MTHKHDFAVGAPDSARREELELERFKLAGTFNPLGYLPLWMAARHGPASREVVQMRRLGRAVARARDALRGALPRRST